MPVKSLHWHEALFSFFLVIILFPPVCLSQDAPLVKTWLGKIRGSWKTSYDGRTYAAFEGIPYAKPPIEDLRFEEPQDVEPWGGIWSATKLYTCLQLTENFVVVGSEDCLYLNIFVPADFVNAYKKTYNVMVIIHGGGFMMGSAQQMANSRYLMDRDWIVVTFNYRLNIFGFLSTEDEVIPGNNGMKDQVQALKWVKLNIASFGGNPNDITIAGVSAGGASVHLHYLSPLSKGLFARGISNSGTALNPWAIKKHPLQNARKMASLVNCPHSSSKELKACFKKKQGKEFLDKMKYFYGYGTMPFSPFAPVIEIKSKHPYISHKPYSLLKQKRVADLPWVLSTCSHDGLLPAALYYQELTRIDKDWPEIAHFLLDYNYTVPIAKRRNVALQIKEHFVGIEKFSRKTFQNFTQMFSERLFIVGSEMAAKLQSEVNESPVYYYIFNYALGENNIAHNFTIEGVSHGEDAIYCYGAFIFKEFSEEDKRVRNTCLDIFKSYVTTGTPAFGRAILWKPTKGPVLAYLNITNSQCIKMHRTDTLINTDLWNQVGLLDNEPCTIRDEL